MNPALLGTLHAFEYQITEILHFHYRSVRNSVVGFSCKSFSCGKAITGICKLFFFLCLVSVTLKVCSVTEGEVGTYWSQLCLSLDSNQESLTNYSCALNERRLYIHVYAHPYICSCCFFLLVQSLEKNKINIWKQTATKCSWTTTSSKIGSYKKKNVAPKLGRLIVEQLLLLLPPLRQRREFSLGFLTPEWALWPLHRCTSYFGAAEFWKPLALGKTWSREWEAVGVSAQAQKGEFSRQMQDMLRKHLFVKLMYT